MTVTMLRPTTPAGSRAHSLLPPGGQVRRLALSGTKGVVGQCREFTRRALQDWGWLPGADQHQQAVAEDVLLLVSEMVTNACLHAGGPSEFIVHGTPERLHIEVIDPSLQAPVPRTPQGTRPGGHGLYIVDRLADAWGTQLREDSKSVWFQVRSPWLP